MASFIYVKGTHENWTENKIIQSVWHCSYNKTHFSFWKHIIHTHPITKMSAEQNPQCPGLWLNWFSVQWLNRWSHGAGGHTFFDAINAGNEIVLIFCTQTLLCSKHNNQAGLNLKNFMTVRNRVQLQCYTTLWGIPHNLQQVHWNSDTFIFHIKNIVRHYTLTRSWMKL
jgi:hypothetical protein